MFCKKCGGEIVEGNLFCTSCGAEIDEETLALFRNAVNSDENSENSTNTTPEVIYPTAFREQESREPEEQMIFVSDVVAENEASDNKDSIVFPEIEKSALQIEYSDTEESLLKEIDKTVNPAQTVSQTESANPVGFGTTEPVALAESVSPAELEKSAESPYADYLAKHPNAYVGNKKYVSMDSIKNSTAISSTQEVTEEDGLNELEDGKKNKSAKQKGKNNTVLIIVIVIALVLLIIACGIFAFFQFRDQLFGSKEDEFQEELYEPEQTEDIEDIATEDNADADTGDEVSEETVQEEVSDDLAEEGDAQVETEADEEIEEPAEQVQETVNTGSFNINVDLPENIQFVSADDRTIQYLNSESGYSIIIDLNPDSSILSDEHSSELIKNMIPISYHGNVAILIYDETEQYNNIDSFAQPFIDKYYPDIESPFALAAEICHDDMTMDYSIYVGGAFSDILPDNNTYDRFDVSVNEYGSVSKGFLFTLGDWLYERGYNLPGYSGDHSMFSVNINQGPLKMREEPSSESFVVTLIEAGTIVSVYNESDGWYCVRLGDDTGWVKAEYCSKIQY